MPTPFRRTLRALEADRRGWVRWWLAAAAAGTAAWTAWFLLARVPVHASTPWARVEVDPPPARVQAEVAGRVIAASLELDARVEAGAVLVRLDTTTVDSQLAEARTRLTGLQARLDRIAVDEEAELAAQGDQRRAAAAVLAEAGARARAAASEAAAAETEADQAEALGSRGVGSAAEAQRARSRALERRATADAETLRGARLVEEQRVAAAEGAQRLGALAAERTRLTAERDAQQAAVDGFERDLARYQLRAPIAGRLGEVAQLRVGGYLDAGAPVATVVPQGRLHVVAEFAPGEALGRLRPGQPARLRLDGFPWIEYGTVGARVRRVASESRDGRVRVELDVDGPANPRIRLEHGLPGSLDVEVERVSPATLVLRAAGRAVTPAPPAAPPRATR